MISNIQKFRTKLASGTNCLGSGITFCDPAVTEALSNVVDFLWIDLEHNPIGMESLLSHLIAARAGGAPALVRIPGLEVPMLKRVLDTGAEGIICPQVRSATEVAQLVSACRYPPLGDRGWGPRRPTNYGSIGFKEYLEDANHRLFVAAQIEHIDACNEIEEIVNIEGLDAIALGPQDLSASMGRLGEIKHPEVVAQMTRVVRAARDANLFVGAGMDANVQTALDLAGMGVQWLQVGSDFSYMLQASKQLFDDIRQTL